VQLTTGLGEIVSVEERVIEVERLDAFEETPVLDITPYAPGQDSAGDIRVPDWPKPR
jgi:tRNA (Thr-GGU) A37 N-methylase